MSTSEAAKAETNATIELNASRVVVLQSAAKTFTLTFRRLTAEDWLAFYENITIGNERDGRDMVRFNDFESPALAITARALIDAQGYTLVGDDAGKLLTSLDNWISLVPQKHRVEAGSILARVVPAPVDDSQICLGGQPVSISCVWHGTDGMALVSGLRHTFAAPTELQHRRYARESSLVRVLGGKRTGTTLYPVGNRVLAELYDELVLSVEGYTVDGAPLVGREAIAREMDTHHKVVAARQIFEPDNSVVAKLNAVADAPKDESEAAE